MLQQLLFAPITGFVWIAEQVHDRVMEELDQKEILKRQLLSLQNALEFGQISEEDYDEQEEKILLALQAIEDAERAAIAG
jgi:Gas vesicle protein G